MSADDIALYQIWADQLGQKMGIPTLLRLDFSSDMAILEALRDHQIAITQLTPWAFIYGYQRGWVEPGMMDLTYDGKEGTAISIIARADSGLQPGSMEEVLKQLQGKKPCYSRENPNDPFPLYTLMDGYILPAGWLALQSVQTAAPVFVEGDSYSPVAVAVFRQQCDFGAIEEMTTQIQNLFPPELENAVSFDQWAKQMRVLFTTPILKPTGLFAYASSLPSAQRERLNTVIAGIGYPYKSPWKDYELKMATFQPELYAQFGHIIDLSGVDIGFYLRSPKAVLQPITTPTPAGGAPPLSNALVVDVETFNSGPPFLPFMNSRPLNRLVLPAIYAELARLDAMGQFFPYLAAELPSMENGLVRFIGSGEEEQLEVEFRLRPNLRWQNGQPLTAADLVFSWQYVIDPGWPGSHYGQAGYAPEIYAADVRAPAGDKVVYRFMSQKQARQAAADGGRLGMSDFYAELVDQNGPVVPLDFLDVGRNVFPQHLLADISPAQVATSDFASHPVYAGAYQLVVDSRPEKPVTLQAFAGFVLGKPAIEKVFLGSTYFSDNQSSSWLPPDQLLAALMAGNIQAQLDFPGVNSREGEDPAGYQAISRAGIATVTWEPISKWETLDFNLANSHLADLKVRQAIAHAIDRQAIIDQVIPDQGDVAKSYLPAWHPLYAGDANLPDYAYDPSQARALLQQAGYDLNVYPAVHPTRGPLKLELDSMDVNLYPRQAIAALIQKQLAAVGVQVEVKFFDWAEFEGQDCSAVRNGRRFDLGMAAWAGTSIYPVGFVEQALVSAAIPTRENGCAYLKSNWSGWSNPQADTLAARLADGRLALEKPAEYRALWAEHQKLWANDLPSLPLFNFKRPVAAIVGLNGLQPSPFARNGVEDTWNIFQWVIQP